MSDSAGEAREKTLRKIHEYYNKRKNKPSPGAASRESRYKFYEQWFRQVDLIPLDDRWILDVGCATGIWLNYAHEHWGAKLGNCRGVELRKDMVEKTRRMFPDLQIHLGSADNMPFEDEKFDLIHQSLMFSSVPSEDLRKAIGKEMWRVLKPGGYISWFDFILNPFNRYTKGIRKKDIRILFPKSQWIYCKRISLAPPLARILNSIRGQLVTAVERLWFANAYYMVLMKRI